MVQCQPHKGAHREAVHGKPIRRVFSFCSTLPLYCMHRERICSPIEEVTDDHDNDFEKRTDDSIRITLQSPPRSRAKEKKETANSYGFSAMHCHGFSRPYYSARCLFNSASFGGSKYLGLEKREGIVSSFLFCFLFCLSFVFFVFRYGFVWCFLSFHF